jgi:uncharacterized protein (TIGR00369 family)
MSLQIEGRRVGAGVDWGERRTREVTWYDPLLTAAKGFELSGREFLEAIRDGTVPPPPIASLLGFSIDDIGDGEVTFSVTPDESVYNPIGMVHGGFACTLLDTVVGCAVQTTLPAGTAYTSVEIKVNYLRPILAGTGPLVSRGWVTKPGRRVAFAEGDIRDADGRVMATASSTLLVMSAPDG